MHIDKTPKPKVSVKPKSMTATNSVNLRSDVKLELPNININDDAAVVIFVVIGVVVVAVLFVYAGKYIYDVIMTDKKYEYWVDSSMNYTMFSSDRSENNGNMVGYKISSGFKDGKVGVGASAEAGVFGFSFSEAEEEFFSEYSGYYFMAGPYIKYTQSNEAFLFMEMLGGKSNNRDIGTLAAARAGIKGDIGNNMVVGISYGAMYGTVNNSVSIR